MVRKPTRKEVTHFHRVVYDCYRRLGRSFPWRETDDPYEIFVSEMMLQQTPVQRVMGKYEEFLKHFPIVQKLAEADLSSVLKVWSGIGYNRRALYLRNAARKICEIHGGTIPSSLKALLNLPGVGQSTAGALLNFAFRIPTPFVETNIRRAITHFFQIPGETRDGEILSLVDATMDRKNPRTWFYALMDYGASLRRRPEKGEKKEHRHEPFRGSRREKRGKVLRALLSLGELTLEELERETGEERSQLTPLLRDMVEEGLLKQKGEFFLVGE
ncbi:MAG: A/G-specific adenine glycosylase [Deltaproteobacteria bacterium]|nr:MAG: A/G-specific adenine glycosylase [Deltaproteobacteria bacterium]